MNRRSILAAALAAAFVPCARAQASAASLVDGGVKYPVPSPLRDSVEARKAGLADLKIGVGLFQHLYTVKLSELGMPSFKPVGPVESYDFVNTVPKGWEQGLNKGEYGLRNDRPSGDSFKALAGTHSDFIADVGVRWVSGAENLPMGLIFNDPQPPGNCYIFGISHYNGYYVSKLVSGQWMPLRNWTKDPSIVATDGVNRLHLERHGVKLSLSINGHPVYEGVDEGVSSGQIGVYVGGQSVVGFSGLSVQETLADETAETALGSGYDYADEFMDGMVRSGLFKADQVGPSNFPKGETWDYVIENPSLTTAGRGGVHVTVKKRDTGDVILDQQLPLAAEWDKKPYVQIDSGVTERDVEMRRLGEYTAYLVADKLLAGYVPPAPKKQ